MKLIANVFLISLLFACNYSNAQRDRVFKSIEEALTVPADSVYRLDLSKNKLTEVPKEIMQFKYLQELNLAKNKLTEIPAFFDFEDLRILDLSKNDFTEFPVQVCKVVSIRNLFLGKNDIKVIPDEIGNMQSLIVLDLWYNPIDDLPEALTKLRNLRSLDLSGLNFSKTFQKEWNEKLSWVKIEFEAACDCNN
ncbi:MAG: leucine-rich repeat domain-containing protein [Crocinitomicaceae bacterium]